MEAVCIVECCAGQSSRLCKLKVLAELADAVKALAQLLDRAGVGVAGQQHGPDHTRTTKFPRYDTALRTPPVRGISGRD
jgi:hypothetical protein